MKILLKGFYFLGFVLAKQSDVEKAKVVLDFDDLETLVKAIKDYRDSEFGGDKNAELTMNTDDNMVLENKELNIDIIKTSDEEKDESDLN